MLRLPGSIVAVVAVCVAKDSAEGRLVLEDNIVVETVAREPLVVEIFDAGIVPFDMIRDWIVRVGKLASSPDVKTDIASIQ